MSLSLHARREIRQSNPSRPRKHPAIHRSALGVAALLLAASTAGATTYTWDADLLSGNGASAGSGTWDTPFINQGGTNAGSAAWFTGTSVPDTRWSAVNYLSLNVPHNDDAVFAGGDGAGFAYPVIGSYFVAVGNVQANSITFNNSGYNLTNLTNCTITLTGSAAIKNNTSGTTYLNTPITGTAGLTLSSTAGGTIWLASNSSTYTGATTIASGTVNVNYTSSGTTSSAFGAGTTTITLGLTSANATLAMQEGGNTNAWNQNLTVAGSGTDTIAIANAQGSNATNNPFGDVQLKIPVITLSNALTLQSVANSALRFGINNATQFTGTGNITIAGAGTVDMETGTSNFTGNINVTQGTFEFGGDAALGNVANSITNAANTALYINGGSNANTRSYTVGGSGVLWSRIASGGAFRINGQITDGGNGLTLTGAEGFAAPSNDIEFGGNNAATLTGALTLGGVSLRVYPQPIVPGTSALGSATATMSMDNAWLEINNSVASGVAINKGGLTFAGQSTVTVSGTTSTAPITFASLTRSGAGVFLPTTGVASGGVFDNTVADRTPINGIVAPYIRQSGSGDFMNYAANGFVTATYTTALTTGASSAAIVNLATAPVVLGADSSAYALKSNQNISGAFTLYANTGGLTVSGGTISTTNLDFRNASSVAQEAIVGVFGSTSVNAVIQNANGLTVFGTNTLTLGGTAANTYTGITTVEGSASLALNKTGAVAIPGDAFVNLGATLSNTQGSQLASTSNVTVSGTWNLNNNSESISSLTINNTSQNYGLARSGGTVNTGTGTNVNSLTVGSLNINAGATLNMQGTNATAGNNSLTVSGAGVTTLTSQSINGAGYLALMNLLDRNSLTTGTGGLSMTGGDIRTNSSTASAVNLNGNVTTFASPFPSYIGDPSSAQGLGLLNLGSSSRTFTIADGAAVDDLSIRAQITGTGSAGIIKTGPGRMRLVTAVASSYPGDTTILQGTLATDLAIPNGTIQMGGNSQVGDSTFLLTTGITFARPINVTSGGTGTVTFASVGGSTMNGGITLGKDLILSQNDSVNTLTYSGSLTSAVAGVGNLIKTGPGTVKFTGASPSFSGDVSILQGTINLGIAGTLGTSTDPILIGDTSSTATSDAALFAVVAYTLPNNITVQAGSKGTATIGENINAAVVLNGNITFNKNMILSAAGSGNLQINGTLTGNNSSGIAVIGGNTVIYQNTAAPSFSGGTIVNAGTLRWQLNQATAAAANVQFGSSNIVLNGGTFDFSLTPAAGSGDNLVNLTNAITVTQAGGTLAADNTNTNGNRAGFNGAIALGGLLNIDNVQNAGNSAKPTLYAGLITIDQSAPGLRGVGFTGQQNQQYALLTGNIIDGAGSAANALTLRASTSNPFMISGTNTYAGGTIIEQPNDNSTTKGNLNGATGTMFVASASSLGTGNVNILEGGRLQLASSSNLGGSATITLGATQNVLSVFSVGYNGIPSNIIAPNGGVLALDNNSNFTTSINEATLGNGKMYVGAIGNQGITNLGATITTTTTLTGTLSPGQNPANAGVNDTYRLGGGGGTLTLNGSNALTSTNKLIVGALAENGNGTISLTNQNDFSGGITINNISTLSGTAQTTAGISPFGSASNVVALSGGSLILGGIAANTKTDLGQVTVEGAGTLGVTQGNANTNLLRVASLNTRSSTTPYGLYISTDTLANLGVTSGKGIQVVVSAQPSTTNGMVAPYIQAWNPSGTTADFLNYTGTGSTATGFVLPTYTNYSSAGTLTGAGSTSNNANVSFAQTLAAGGEAITVNSLRTSASISNGASASTITVTSGGIIANASSTIAPNLAFSSAEAVIGVYKSDQSLTLSGPLSGTGGLTKLGTGTLTLSSTTSSISGQLSVLAGTVSISAATNLGSLSSIYLDGGGLTISPSTVNLTQPITLGNLGGGFDTGNNGTNSTLSGNITDAVGAKGMLLVQNASQGTLTLAGTGNTYSGGTYIGGSANRSVFVNNTSSLGTGDVSLRLGLLRLQGNANISSSATLFTSPGTTTYFQSDAPAIGALEGSGLILLGGVDDTTNPASFVSGTINANSADHHTTLTVGNANNTYFDGTIADDIGTRANAGATLVAAQGYLTKVGSGQLTLAGVNTYTGATTISVGVLNITGSLGQTAVTVATNGALSGSGTVGFTASGVIVNGLLAPGNKTLSPASGALTITSSLSLAANSTFSPTISALPSASSSVIVSSTGSVSISTTASFVPIPGTTPNAALTYVVIDDQSNQATAGGTFAGMPEGTQVTVGGVPFDITYQYNVEGSGPSNDVALVPVPEPTSVALLALGAVGLLARRRRGAR